MLLCYFRALWFSTILPTDLCTSTRTFHRVNLDHVRLSFRTPSSKVETIKTRTVRACSDSRKVGIKTKSCREVDLHFTVVLCHHFTLSSHPLSLAAGPLSIAIPSLFALRLLSSSQRQRKSSFSVSSACRSSSWLWLLHCNCYVRPLSVVDSHVRQTPYVRYKSYNAKRLNDLRFSRADSDLWRQIFGLAHRPPVVFWASV